MRVGEATEAWRHSRDAQHGRYWANRSMPTWIMTPSPRAWGLTELGKRVDLIETPNKDVGILLSLTIWILNLLGEDSCGGHRAVKLYEQGYWLTLRAVIHHFKLRRCIATKRIVPITPKNWGTLLLQWMWATASLKGETCHIASSYLSPFARNCCYYSTLQKKAPTRRKAQLP